MTNENYDKIISNHLLFIRIMRDSNKNLFRILNKRLDRLLKRGINGKRK